MGYNKGHFPWELNIPMAGNEQKDKVFYGWFDNHLYYISSLIGLLQDIDKARKME